MLTPVLKAAMLIMLTLQTNLVVGLDYNNDSTLLQKESPEDHQIADDLTNLLKRWYIENSYSHLDSVFDYGADEEVPDVSDSIIKDRLSGLPTLIHLTYNEKVRSWIDLYTKRNRKQVANLLGLSEYYFPMFEDIFDRYDVPLELKYLAIIESALNPVAVSRAGATGIWQFMYTTGKVYKLTMTSHIDERRDPVRGTHAAAQLLRDLYSIYGDWTLAIAAYNCGPGNVNKAIKRAGGKTDYWEIYPYLPRETRGYVPAFIGALYAMTFYKEHKIIPRKINYPIAVDTVMVTHELHLQQVSEVLQIPIEQLQEFNPQYKKDIIPAINKKYPLMLPIDYINKFIELEDSIYNYNDSLFFKIPGKLNETSISSSSSKYEEIVHEAPTADHIALTYTIKAGDNLGFIASWYDVTVAKIKGWNNMYGNSIRAGQKLTIHKHKDVAEKYKGIDNMSFEAKQKMIGKEVSSSANNSSTTNNTTTTTNTQTSGSGKYVMYTVKSGDNFWTIAKKYPGVSNTDIMKLNGITNPGSLKVGQKLKIKPL
ncbi:MAG: LysM peptidoglycan-binding domain-containing protein [Bacteroidales bacterium]|nr:LysM peptidoglycan-binding domain-containing protein [Bacteroidales bacterium]